MADRIVAPISMNAVCYPCSLVSLHFVFIHTVIYIQQKNIHFIQRSLFPNFNAESEVIGEDLVCIRSGVNSIKIKSNRKHQFMLFLLNS